MLASISKQQIFSLKECNLLYPFPAFFLQDPLEEFFGQVHQLQGGNFYIDVNVL